MKARTWLGVILLLLATAGTIGIVACSGRGPSGAAGEKAVRYHCPMHPTYTSDRPGDCPICGMRLVPIEEKTEASGPVAEYRCPMCEGVKSAKPGDCPKCGMKLAPVAVEAPKKKTVWRSTMNPEEVSDHPGKDSMGMDMVPVEVEEGGAGKVPAGLATITVPEERRQLIGLRTDTVRRGPLTRTIRASGRVAVDERLLAHVHTKFEGWIEKLYVATTGEAVRRGEPLFTIYSPDVLATQEEYLIALRTSRTLASSHESGVAAGGRDLLEAARRRLRLWDVSDAQIERLEREEKPQRAITLYSPANGIVLEKNAIEGQRVMPGDDLFTIADLSRVWILADVYDYELPFVETGQEASLRLSYLPGVERRGEVTYVYPTLDPATRTVRVRIEFANPGLELKPEMYGDVEIAVDLGERLVVPDAALLHTGERNIAFVDLGDGRIEPREVKVGLRTRDLSEVLSGLAEGERIVVSANFLVDSESQLKAALAAMAGQGGAK